jgi:GNAT superfamily N-acetyltransferase
MKPNIELVGYYPGAIGDVTRLHAVYYSENWGFDVSFESWVAQGLAEFFSRFDGDKDLFLCALAEGEFAGAIAIHGNPAEGGGARLRWYIVDPAHTKKGIGTLLLNGAVDFCREAGHERVFLWTFEGLDPARRLYEAAGFRLTEEHVSEQWGGKIKEQKFELVF